MYMPAEYCDVLPGQVSMKKLNPDQTARMIKVACRRPHENAQSIVDESGAVLGLLPASNPILVSAPVRSNSFRLTSLDFFRGERRPRHDHSPRSRARCAGRQIPREKHCDAPEWILEYEIHKIQFKRRCALMDVCHVCKIRKAGARSQSDQRPRWKARQYDESLWSRCPRTRPRTRHHA